MAITSGARVQIAYQLGKIEYLTEKHEPASYETDMRRIHEAAVEISKVINGSDPTDDEEANNG